MKKIHALAVTSILLLSACADLPTAEQALRDGDYGTARKHMETLADYNFPQAQTDLALMLMKGQGGPADSYRAVELLQKAADANYPQAQFELGRVYQQGEIVKADLPKAESLYMKAQAAGYVRSSFQLGTLYEQKKDYVRAESFYKQALKGGYYRAAVKIADLYDSKEKRAPDPVEALAWYYYAKAHDVEVPAGKVAKIESIVTPQQVAQAKALSQGWLSHD